MSDDLGNVRLIYNPVSGQASFKNNLDYLIERFQKRGNKLYLIGLKVVKML